MTAAAWIVRVAVTAAFLALVITLTGRRRVSSATTFDLLVALLLGGGAAALAAGTVGIAEGIIGLAVIAWLHLLTATAARRFPRVQRWVWGSPALLVRDGVVQRQALAREGMTTVQLDDCLREAGAERLKDVHELWLEPDGAVSLLRQTPGGTV